MSDDPEEKLEDAFVRQLTVGGAVSRADGKSGKMKVRFSKSRKHVYLADGTVLRKVKGGHKGGVMKGQYEDVETGDMYSVNPKV